MASDRVGFELSSRWAFACACRGWLPPPEGKMIGTSDRCSYRCCEGGSTSCTWFHASLPELVCNRLLLKFVGKRTRTESASNTVCPAKRNALKMFYRGGTIFGLLMMFFVMLHTCCVIIIRILQFGNWHLLFFAFRNNNTKDRDCAFGHIYTHYPRS